MGEGSGLRLDALIGRSVERLRARLGTETTAREAGGGRWLVYERPDAQLRVRLVPVDPASGVAPGRHRVASWTVTFHRPPGSTEELARRLGIPPVPLAPVEPDAPLLRAPLPDPGTGALHSLTVLRRGGRYVQATAFDEPPDWIDEGGTA